MKKISKLVINPEKLMKNEELLSLKGGDLNIWSCYCELDFPLNIVVFWPSLGETEADAMRFAELTVSQSYGIPENDADCDYCFSY